MPEIMSLIFWSNVKKKEKQLQVNIAITVFNDYNLTIKLISIDTHNTDDESETGSIWCIRKRNQTSFWKFYNKSYLSYHLTGFPISTR